MQVKRPKVFAESIEYSSLKTASMLRRMLSIGALAVISVAQTLSHNNIQEVSFENLVIPGDGYIPNAGFVPTADVALIIAEAVLAPVYGKDVVLSERPFHATLNKQIWVVKGTTPCPGAPMGRPCPGGNAEIWISKANGRILYMTHSM